MKTTIYFVVIMLGLSATGCGYKKYSDQLTKEKLELSAIVDERDSTINELNEIVSKIQSDLESLADQEKELALLDVKEHYGENERQLVESINTLMKNNKERIQSLQQRLSQMNSNIRRVGDLNEQIDELTGKLTQSEDNIRQLNQRVAGLNTSVESRNAAVDSLKTINSAREREIFDLNQKLHEAYYVIGDKNSLKEKNIIVKEGGFLGIGRVEKLVPEFDRSSFTQIDTRNTTKITLPQGFNKIELVTPHSADSYTIDNNELAIVNPEVFWGSSKYLVIQEF